MRTGTGSGNTAKIDVLNCLLNIETVLDVDRALWMLAFDNVLVNLDSYIGQFKQNYYLYNDPDNSKLTWIPWDMNEALEEGKMGGALELDFSDIQSGAWPLIDYLYADAVYKAKYDEYVEETKDVFFEENMMKAIYTNYSALIETYATTERNGYSFLNSSSDFQQAVSALNQHVSSRASAVTNYLD